MEAKFKLGQEILCPNGKGKILTVRKVENNYFYIVKNKLGNSYYAETELKELK